MNFLWSQVILGQIYSRLEEAFMIIPEKLFGGLSVLTVADLPQLFPVWGKLWFSSTVWNIYTCGIYLNLQNLLKLWSKIITCLLTCLIKFELVTLMTICKNYLRQYIWRNLMKSWSQDVLHMYAENEPAIRRNEVVWNGLPGNIYKMK